MSRYGPAAALALTLALALAEMSGTVVAADSHATPGQPPYRAVAGTPLAPPLKGRDLAGRDFDLESLRGKVVLVNFWATWCVPCRRELPSLERLWLQMREQPFVIVAVDVGESEDAVADFLARIKPTPTFPVLVDKDSKSLREWPVKGLPTTLLIDRQGRIALRTVGGLEFDSAESLRQIAELLQKND